MKQPNTAEALGNFCQLIWLVITCWVSIGRLLLGAPVLSVWPWEGEGNQTRTEADA